jgi:hypothetical protein|tara:strand:+ start:7252 stop:8559 length:1308 start_codon:yes stop_codon:yes gene_type:complete
MKTKTKNKVKMTKQLKLLTRLYRFFSPSGQEAQVIDYITGLFRDNGIEYRIDRQGNLYAVNHVAGAARVLLNAHMDTVAHQPAKLAFAKQKKSGDLIIRSSNKTVIGGDDKNGVWVVLQMLMDKSIKTPLSALLCVREEAGLVGSQYAMEHHADWLADAIFCMTIDRRGNDEIITHNCDLQLSSGRMIEWLSDHGATFGLRTSPNGSISDISNITDRLNINGVNLCAGYYNAHTGSEQTNYSHLQSTLRYAKELAKDIHAHLTKHPDRVDYTPVATWKPAVSKTYGSTAHGDFCFAGTPAKGYGKLKPTTLTSDEVKDMFWDVLDDIQLLEGDTSLHHEFDNADLRLSKSRKSLKVMGLSASAMDTLYLWLGSEVREITKGDKQGASIPVDIVVKNHEEGFSEAEAYGRYKSAHRESGIDDYNSMLDDGDYPGYI